MIISVINDSDFYKQEVLADTSLNNMTHEITFSNRTIDSRQANQTTNDADLMTDVKIEDGRLLIT